MRTLRVGIDAAENHLLYKSSRLWNNLPEKLCLSSNIDYIKSALKISILKVKKSPMIVLLSF
jgi:hypothetical protein